MPLNGKAEVIGDQLNSYLNGNLRIDFVGVGFAGLSFVELVDHFITPAIKYLNIVIPAKAGIQAGTGCRIKSGMTE